MQRNDSSSISRAGSNTSSKGSKSSTSSTRKVLSSQNGTRRVSNRVVIHPMSYQHAKYVSDLLSQYPQEKEFNPQQYYPLQTQIPEPNDAKKMQKIFVAPSVRIFAYDLTQGDAANYHYALERLKPVYLEKSAIEANKPYEFILDSRDARCYEEYSNCLAEGQFTTVVAIFRQRINIIDLSADPNKYSALLQAYLDPQAGPDFPARKVWMQTNPDTSTPEYYMQKERLVRRQCKDGTFKFAVQTLPEGASLPPVTEQNGVDPTLLGVGVTAKVNCFGGKIRNPQGLFKFSRSQPDSARAIKKIHSITFGGKFFHAKDIGEREFTLTEQGASYKVSQLVFGSDYCLLITEMLWGQELLDIVNADLLGVKKLAVEERFALIAAILAQLIYMYSKHVINSDLKLENIRLAHHNDIGSAKILDFGFAMDVRSGEKRSAGSMAYAAPEMFTEKAPVSLKTEIFSFATIALHLLSTDSNQYLKTELIKRSGKIKLLMVRPKSIEEMFLSINDDDPSSDYYISVQNKQALFDLFVTRGSCFNPDGRPNSWEEISLEFNRIVAAHNQDRLSAAAGNAPSRGPSR